MMNADQDKEQNYRIRDLETRLNTLENQVSALIAKIDTLTNIGKGLMILCGAMVGVDVLPMMGGA